MAPRKTSTRKTVSRKTSTSKSVKATAKPVTVKKQLESAAIRAKKFATSPAGKRMAAALTALVATGAAGYAGYKHREAIKKTVQPKLTYVSEGAKKAYGKFTSPFAKYFAKK